jgi:uncharacterized membrane protein
VVGEEKMSFIMDEEVFAVILAIIVVGSVLGVAMIIRPSSEEPFTALGLLDQNCQIGSYPSTVVNGTNVNLCLFVYNHMGHPIYYEVVYKIGNNLTIPTNTTPSSSLAIKNWRGVLNNDDNETFHVSVPVYANNNETSVALIFELWIYNLTTNEWQYTGIWNHLYVNITFPGG